MVEADKKALRLAEREWAPSYVCTHCGYCGVSESKFCSCGYEMTDINAEARAMATLIRAQQERVTELEAEKKAAERLGRIYFDIAASAIGEDEVRRRRDEIIDLWRAALTEEG